MTANSQPQNADARIRELERLMRDLLRTGHGRAPHVRDLRDTDAAKVVDGQAMVYRKSDGKWHPLSLFLPFDLSGALSLSVSDRYYPTTTTRVRRLFASLKTAGSTATTVRLLRNGAFVTGTSVTIAASAHTAAADFDATFAGPETDWAQMEVTAAGTGAQGLVVQVY